MMPVTPRDRTVHRYQLRQVLEGCLLVQKKVIKRMPAEATEEKILVGTTREIQMTMGGRIMVMMLRAIADMTVSTVGMTTQIMMAMLMVEIMEMLIEMSSMIVEGIAGMTLEMQIHRTVETLTKMILMATLVKPIVEVLHDRVKTLEAADFLAG